MREAAPEVPERSREETRGLQTWPPAPLPDAFGYAATASPPSGRVKGLIFDPLLFPCNRLAAL